MNSQQAKQIRLTDYLNSLGYNPVTIQGDNIWYYSPFREEKSPSFKISHNKNVWYDFGLGKGGTIIDFAMEYYQSNNISFILQNIVKKEIRNIESFSFQKQNDLPLFEEMIYRPLQNKTLLNYLKERGIPNQVAYNSCHEIHYKYKGKGYFAIGFLNQSGGYELRNKYFKGCIAPKDISYIKNNSEACSIFEGFIDYLSYLTLQQTKLANLSNEDKQDYIILNSVTNLSNALPHLQDYQKISCFLDNDPSGKQAVEKIKKSYKGVIDKSILYDQQKDLNDFLRSKKNPVSQKQELSPKRRLR